MSLPYSRDITTFGPLPHLKLDIPTGKSKKAETSFTVAFVNPRYAATSQQYLIRAPGGYRKADEAKKLYLDRLIKSLKIDMDQILLSKGIRVIGPFKSYDEMTFDNKKIAIYTLEPEVSIDIGIVGKGKEGLGYTEEGIIKVQGNVYLILRESITSEKVWVKRFDLDPITKPYKLVAKMKQTRGAADIVLTAGIKEEDNSDLALAETLKIFYNNMGKKIWKHIDPEEWSKYLPQAKKLRKEKRY